ncbi:hypothetical protein KL911_004389 [Ogataea haglerorum]|uniref:MHD domain-containing protein n=1 Tax=Ogataea haglerorum TaxID=1937702 RepID=A0ABQ7RAE1_9ASCO|nr:uncharacterized protein KL911_004389 [Ogataea haglerorum]KAG7704100.1 hypothetical protein KL950_004427 [Ogataea haglerorum]KAG7751811.1 hypothetical protein KL911_004389 [Ogataea haglerorum]KAG7762183.1 hypothetical protein KL946_004830 [Ogataea haglerorum]
MGLIDCLFIADGRNLPIFEHIVNSPAPTFQYVKDRLNSMLKGEFEDPGSSNSVFDHLDPVLDIDANWRVAWTKIDAVYLIVAGETFPEYTEVVSDDDDDDDEDEGDDAQEQKETVTISRTANDLQYLQFLADFGTVVKSFLNGAVLTPAKVELNAHNLLLILQEMVDASFPYLTDLNQLQELLPSNSILNKIISTTKQIQGTASHSINSLAQGSSLLHASSSASSLASSQFQKGVLPASCIFEKSGNEIPWRKVNVKHTQNEMLVDLVERISWIVPASKSPKPAYGASTYYNLGLSAKKSRPVMAAMDGTVYFNSSLSGVPTVQLVLNLNKHDLGVPSFHRCVDTEIWSKSPGVVQFIPPDDKFMLMKYKINLLETETPVNVWNYMGPVDVELVGGLGVERNEFEIKLQTKLLKTVKFIEDLKVEILVPKGHTVRGLRITHGDLQSRNGVQEWILDKSLPTGINCTFRGQLLRSGGDSSALRPDYVTVSYSNKGSVPSLIKVDSMKIISGGSTNVKPYKGVKYITHTNNIMLR